MSQDDRGRVRIRCACGWETSGTEDEAAGAAIEHGLRVHNMAATRDQVLATAEPLANEPADAPADEPADQPIVVDAPDAGRYEARLDGTVVGFSEYRRVGERIVFLHTEVDEAYEGRGFGSRLARGALDDARARGLRVSAKCPFIAAYLRRHRDYDDIVAR
jgi:predicted GNAT family acetyltransferase